jgi:glycosyltransferase involved in cell wall biosynthesis
MIVKNEVHCIERCLKSVLPIIDSWSIVDTGSTDGTQDKIKEFFRDKVPGVLHERPWRDFAHNRTESIQLARLSDADYGLVIDADDTLELPTDYVLPELTSDSYRVRIEFSGSTYYRTHLFRLNKPFKYVSVIHEYLTCDGLDLETEPMLEGVVYRCYPEGNRSKGDATQKFLKDAEVLREALRKEPYNPRYAYYLAQSLKDAGKTEKAIQTYEKRAVMTGGWVEETWLSLHEIGRLSVWLNKPEQIILNAFLKAYEYRPERIEPVYELSYYYRTRKNRPAVAYIYAAAGYGKPRPNDRLMLDESIYKWRLEFEYAVTSFYADRKVESKLAHERLLINPHVEETEREAIESNMRFFT